MALRSCHCRRIRVAPEVHDLPLGIHRLARDPVAVEVVVDNAQVVAAVVRPADSILRPQSSKDSRCETPLHSDANLGEAWIEHVLIVASTVSPRLECALWSHASRIDVLSST